MDGIRIVARPWEFQDLLDDLEYMIDEEPNTYLNERRHTLCMAKGFLEDAYKSCEGCVWRGKRPQKCSCCRRNQLMKDCYERMADNE